MEKLDYFKLWDAYAKLLTQTQRDVGSMYFELDLTVSEIAEEKGISRQGVFDCLNIIKKQFEDYENKLGFSKRLEAIDSAAKWAEEFKGRHPEHAAEVLALTEILSVGGEE